MSEYDDLIQTIEHLAHPGKGILAADESINTIGKRFASIQIENHEENRKDYRLLLANTQDLGQYIGGVILFEETFEHKNNDGVSIPELFQKQHILPGIKVDKGLVDLPHTEGEQMTQGLDGLQDRLKHFKAMGAKFAKWRNVFRITDYTPSLASVKSSAEALAIYAATCQQFGIVPIVEPELLIDGNHTIEHAAEASEVILHEVFNALFLHQVALECIVLKPSMVTCGIDYAPFSSPEEVAEFTMSVFRNQVPAAVPTINFLSGGQTPEQSIVNLNAMNKVRQQPWLLSFSYGRALQEACLNTWKGESSQVELAQAELLKAAQACSQAACGEYHPG